MKRAALATLALALLASSAQAHAAGATVTVDVARTTGPLPSDAVGLSYEMRTVGEGGFDATTGNEAAVFTTLGVRNIRIGGNTVDYGTFWQPGGKPVPPWASIIITPADVQRVAAFARAIDAKVAWAVNIQHLDPASIDDQAGAVVTAFGDALDSIQCGNEPNGIFGGYAAFKTAFDACKTALKGRAKISGPDTYGGGGAWNAKFVDDEAAALNQLNYHYYTGARSVAALLAPAAISGAMKAIDGSLAAARAHALGYRTDETNSEAGGGIHGVSDVFGSALWAMHYALASAERGAGVNFHGFLGVCGQPTVNGKNDYYTPICAASVADAKAKVMTAAPEFYGLWMATHLGPGQFHPITVAGAPNLVAYAVKGDDGATRIALIEKSATGGKLPVTITLPGASGTARVLRMTGPSLNASTGVQIQGASLDHDGHLVPGPPDEIPASDAIALELATGSAALVTIGNTEKRPDAGAEDAAGDDARADTSRLEADTALRPDTTAVTADSAVPTIEEPPSQPRSGHGGCDLGGARGEPPLLLILALVLRRARWRRVAPAAPAGRSGWSSR